MDERITEYARTLAAEASSKPEDPSGPGRFASSTIITLTIGVVASIVCLVTARTTSDEVWMVIAYSGLPLFVIAALAGIIKFLSEALFISPRDRTTPEKAIKAYILQVKRQRWKAAFSCLSWSMKTGKPILRPAMPDLDLAQAEFKIDKPRTLGLYWKDFSGLVKTRGERSWSCTVMESNPVSDSLSVVVVRWSITLNLQTASITGEAVKRHGSGDRVCMEISTCWPVYKRDNLWYLLSPGFPENVSQLP